MDKKDLLKIAKTVLLNEAESIKHAGEMLDDSIASVVELIYESQGNVVLTGIGKSGDIARKIASTLSSIGVFSHFLHPSEALHGDLGRIKDGDVIILLSHSGETEELIVLLEKIAHLQIEYKLVAITAKPDSTLARLAHLTLLTHVTNEARKKGENYFLTPTVSTTVTLAIGDAIACALQELMDFQPHHFHKFHPGGQLGAKLRDIVNANESDYK